MAGGGSPIVVKTKPLFSQEVYFYNYAHFSIILIINRTCHFGDLIPNPANCQGQSMECLPLVKKHCLKNWLSHLIQQCVICAADTYKITQKPQ
jgi:hypothetical protein